MIHIPETKLIPLGDIVLDATNPNAMSDAKFKALKDNIQRYGFLVPIITNKGLKIADGFHRWKAARDLGMEEVPTLVLDVDEVDRRLLRQIMNKLKGQHDEQRDFDEWQWLKDNDAEDLLNKLLPEEDWGMMGLVEEPEVTDDNFDVEKKEQKYDVQPGQIYKLGNHRLMCGDSTDMESVAKLMDGKKSRIIHTDPPYNVAYGETKKDFTYDAIKNDKLTQNDWEIFCKKLYQNFKEFNTGDIYMYGASGPDGILMRHWLIESGCHWSATIIWNKDRLVLSPANYQRQYEPCFYGWYKKSSYNGDRTQTELWTIKRPNEDKLHPTMKPIEVCARAIKNSSKPKEIVLDFFGGSGSTLIACEQLNRFCYMMELDEAYCSTIIERWEEYTGQKAELIE